jgi:arylsulfatase A-like enzyme
MSGQLNILLITTDQQRFDTIQAAGNQYIYTPHLNWLMDSGILYTNAYTDCPICMPARATIMTGKHGHTMNYTGNKGGIEVIDSEYSLPGLLTKAGYQTRAQGKMHFWPNRKHYGFEQMEILDDYYRYMAKHPEKGIPMDHGVGQNEMAICINTIDESNSLTHWTVDRSIDFLETRDTTRPFFLWTSFAKPHSPFDPVMNYWQIYQNASMPEPIRGDWSEKFADVPAGLLSATSGSSLAWRYSKEQITNIRRAYYACITQIDYNLGLLFARMRELDLLKNTLIIFTTDHGDMLGDHWLSAKSVGLEGSAHIPMIIREPQPDWGEYPPMRGTKCNELVCLADVLPTVLAATGTSLPNENKIDGIDMISVAKGEQSRDYIIGDSDQYFYVRMGDYKYLYESISGSELLFNIKEDQYEQHNLFNDEKYEDVLNDLKNILIAHTGVLKNNGMTRKDILNKLNVWPGLHSRVRPDEVAH